ncbi:MAG: selenium metabolism-associated LysR family transcriptional regulator [Syntrophomonadaceae bacterium]|nr:selenium metabolism-associated LysR family transcriptional regulator [Syntrophomonadaceae bacterium]
MNFNLFKTYIRVVETQNLSRTAEEFGFSQPAITKQIQALEEIYGVLLLERSGRKLKPTEAGEILYQYAREIIKILEKTEKAMEEAGEGNKGTLSLGASTIPGQYILPEMIKKFKDSCPYMNICLDIADTEKIFNKVAERELDIGFVGGWINNRKVDGFPWLEDELLVIVPEDHRFSGLLELNLEAILNERWIFREKGSGTRKAVEDLLMGKGMRKEDLNVNMEAGSTEAVMASVESGMGISIVSNWAMKRIDSQRRIKSLKLNDAKAKRSLFIIFPRQKTRRKSVDRFLDFIKTTEIK